MALVPKSTHDIYKQTNKQANKTLEGFVGINASQLTEVVQKTFNN